VSLDGLKNILKIGIESLDHEHRTLVSVLEEIYDAFESGVPAIEVSDLFGGLYDKVSAHFALEERFMVEHKYPLYEAHKADHTRLLERIRDMMDAYEDGMCKKCDVDFRTCMESWFSDHVTDSDSGLSSLAGSPPPIQLHLN